MTRVDCTVHQIILRTADLRKLDEIQRRLLLTLGHAANEMAALYRATHAAGSDAHQGADPITRQIARAQTLLMTRMAASKMKEVFDITDEPKYGKIIKTVYPEFSRTETDIKNIIEKHIDLKTLRDQFGFHYKSSLYENMDTIYLHGSSSDETHEFVFDHKGVNSFFAIAEFFFQKTFAEAMKYEAEL